MSLITLEVEDGKLSFFRTLISHFSFVKEADEVPEEDTDEEVRENIREAVRELREIEAGRKNAQSAREFLKEL